MVKKVRVIIQKFRSSPVKNDSLQEEVKKYGKELSVIRDCRTRWSSLHSMAEIFLLLEDPLNKVLDDLGLEKLKLSSAEIQLVREIVAALEFSMWLLNSCAKVSVIWWKLRRSSCLQ